jgi:CDI immunity protein
MRARAFYRRGRRSVCIEAMPGRLGGNQSGNADMETEQTANVYARNTDFLIEPTSKTESGYRVSSDPVAQLQHTTSVVELGKAIRESLAESRRGVPNPVRGKFPSSLLRVAGVRSWNALQTSAALCHVHADSNTIRIIPTRNGGTKGTERGYHPLEQQVICVQSSASDQELGSAVLATFGKCE